MSHFVPVCRVDEIAEGEARAFPAGEGLVAVFRVGDEFHALANDCPHAGASLALGCVTDGVVSCRIHHWRFCIRTGKYLDQDIPTYNAKTFATRVKDGMVEVDVEASS